MGTVSRSVARTAIQWGMVTIPVSLSLAASAGDSAVKMHQYSPAGNRIAQKRVDSVTGEEVAYADIRRGVEHGSEVVLLDGDDLASLETFIPTSRALTVTASVLPSRIDPMMLTGQVWWLTPDSKIGGSERAYGLLARALRDEGVVLVSAVTLRSRTRPVIIGATDDGVLVAQGLYWPAELRAVPPVPETSYSPAEVEMARQLVRTMAADVVELADRDEYAEGLLALVEAKAGGLALEAAPADEPVVSDLAALLARSLDAVRPAVNG